MQSTDQNGSFFMHLGFLFIRRGCASLSSPLLDSRLLHFAPSCHLSYFILGHLPAACSNGAPTSKVEQRGQETSSDQEQQRLAQCLLPHKVALFGISSHFSLRLPHEVSPYLLTPHPSSLMFLRSPHFTCLPASDYKTNAPSPCFCPQLGSKGSQEL